MTTIADLAVRDELEGMISRCGYRAVFLQLESLVSEDEDATGDVKLAREWLSGMIRAMETWDKGHESLSHQVIL